MSRTSAVVAMAFTALQFVVVAALAAAGATFSEVTTLSGVAAAAMDIAYVGLLSSAFAFTILTLALRHVRPAEVAVIVSLETVFAAAAAYVWLGERLSPFGWAGAALIVGPRRYWSSSGRPGTGASLPPPEKLCAPR